MFDLRIDFLFAEFEEGQPVEVIRTGEFVDRYGRDVEVTAEDLDAYVANFEAGAAGQEIPVDIKHERGEAAGWIKKLWREGDRLLATVDWNEFGRQLVGEKIYRYVSATIDVVKKVVKSVSLVNFPAVKGLRPIELSEGVYTMGLQEGLIERIMQAIRSVLGEVESGEETEETEGLGTEQGEDEHHEEDKMGLTEQERAELREELRQEVLAEFEQQRQNRAELAEEVRAEVEAELAAEYQLRNELREFAEEVCGGEFGLSTDPDEIVELMIGMPEERREQMQSVLRAKVVDFTECGSSRDGEAGKKKLPETIRPMLQRWLDDGNELEKFFVINKAELGEMSQYNLAEFVDKEE